MKELSLLRRALAGASSVLLVLAAPGGGGIADDQAVVVAEPDGYRLDNYRSLVPATLSGARVVTAEEAKALSDAKDAVFIDVYPRPPKPDNLPPGTVWRDPPHSSIAGAAWLPNVGYGTLAEPTEDYFKSQLADLTGSDAAKPVLFFCLRNCWMSWNAAKRALAWGYANVIWFPDGTDGWLELGESLTNVQPAR